MRLRSNVPVFTSIKDEKIELAEKDILYPNPSTDESTLSFYVSSEQFVSVRIFSSSGILVKELTAHHFSGGKHSLALDSEKLSQGFYHIEINKGGSTSFLKFIKI